MEGELRNEYSKLFHWIIVVGIKELLKKPYF